MPDLPPVLLAFAPMIDSQLSRMILTHYGIAYREEDHIFGWVSVLTWLHGGYGQVPVLYGNQLHLTGPRAIVDRFDAAAAHHLLPAGEPPRTAVEADWTRFNGELATHTARIAYYYLLPCPDIMIPAFQRGIPTWEKNFTARFYPELRWLFTLLLRLRPPVIADARTRVAIAVSAAEARLADGREFLVGGGLTLSDLSLASAMAPLVMPPDYAARLPALETMPGEMRQAVAHYRGRPIGAYVDRIFALSGDAEPLAS